MKSIIDNDFINDIKTLLQNARQSVYKNVNTIMTKTYFEVGKRIVEEEQLGSSRAEYGKELLRFKDRHDNSFVLGPTHEEMMVDLVRNRITSYKQLPVNLYQIKTKFRDEVRPRYGLMRGREFIMKDGYSFHSSVEDLDREFDALELAYKKIITRLGLDYRVVEADSGAIGGSGSKEIMVIAQSGEDSLAVCNKCEYGANIEVFMDMKTVDEDFDISTIKNIAEVKVIIIVHNVMVNYL